MSPLRQKIALGIAALAIGTTGVVVATAGSQDDTPDSARELIELTAELGDLADAWLLEHPVSTTVPPPTDAPTTIPPSTVANTTTTAAPPGSPAAVAESLNASNTGWRGAGLTLADLTPSGSITVGASWPVAPDGRRYVERLDVTGQIVVTVPNVTIRHSRVRFGPRFAGVLARYDGTNNASGLVVEWTELDGQALCGAHAGISSAQTVRFVTARRLDVHHSEDGVNLQAASVLEQSYIHDLSKACGTEHRDGIQNGGTDSWDSAGPVIVRDNKIIAPFRTSTSAVRMATDNGSITNFVVERNYLSGGSFTVYADQVNKPISGRVDSNVFVRDSWGAGHWRLQGATTATGNVWHDGGAIPDR